MHCFYDDLNGINFFLKKIKFAGVKFKIKVFIIRKKHELTVIKI